jgi:regulator of sigma D
MAKKKNYIKTWLKQRNDILVILNNLTGLLPKHFTIDVPPSLSNFFQLLIDYTCAGHLQIFSLFINHNSHNFSFTQKVLKKINYTTDCIIKFNTKFNKFKNISANDAVLLLEQFANRIELEDFLLQQFYNINKNYIN